MEILSQKTDMNIFTKLALGVLVVLPTSCRSPRDIAQGKPVWYESNAFWMATGSALAGGYGTKALAGDDVENDAVNSVALIAGVVGWFVGNQLDLEWSKTTQETPPWLLKEQPKPAASYHYNPQPYRFSY